MRIHIEARIFATKPGTERLDLDVPVRNLDLGEVGTPPMVGDSIDIDGQPVIVTHRHWVHPLHVRLLCRTSTAMWAYSGDWT